MTFYKIIEVSGLSINIINSLPVLLGLESNIGEPIKQLMETVEAPVLIKDDLGGCNLVS